MKQLHVKILLVLFLAGTVIPSFSRDRKTYRLELNLKENQRFKQHTRIVMDVSQEAMGKNVEVSTDTRTEMTYLVKSVDKDLITMNFIYDNIRSITNTDMGGTKMEIDSDAPLPESISAPFDLGAIYKAITGIPVSVTMTKKGKVRSVTGTDKLSEAILSTIDTCNLPASTGQSASQLTSQITKQFNEASIKQQLERVSVYFPDKDVAIGDTWNIVMDGHDPYIVTANMDMKLVEVNGNIATIEGNGTISTPGEVFTEQPHGVQLRVNLAGTQSGIIKVDLETGLAVDAEVIFEMEGEVETISVSEKDGEVDTRSRMSPITIL
jgi:hypothetical protein